MATLEQYQAWCLQRIGQLIVNQQLHCQAAIQRGPFALTCTLQITHDPVGGLKKLLTLGPTLRLLLQTNVRIVQSTQGVLIEIELPQQAHTTPNAAKLIRVCRWPQIPLGINQFMQPVTVNPETHGALYWIAPPRSGKTQSMRSTLYLMLSAAYDIRFLICALPVKMTQDWSAFTTVAGCLGLVTDFTEMAQALAWTVDQMSSGAYGGKTIIVLDDLATLATHAPAISPYIDTLALTGPGLGYHLLAGTHGAGSNATTGGKLAGFALTCKILYKAADNQTGARASGRKNAETGLAQLSGAPGDAILDENGRLTRLATAWIRDTDILALPMRGQEGPGTYPWRLTMDLSGMAPKRVVSRGSSGEISRGEKRERLFAEAPAHLFPIQPERPPNGEEAHWLRTLHESGLFSESALTDLAYGRRNTRRLALVRAALAAEAAAPLTANQAAAILEGDPDHPRRQEALRFFQDTVGEFGGD